MTTGINLPVQKTTKAKAWTAGIVTIGMSLTAVFADNVIGAGEVGTFITLLIETAVGIYAVYKVENKPVQ